MIFKLKQIFRYILRRILFKDDCILCNVILQVKENAFCEKCLENLKNISSLKKYKNIYYLWILNEKFLKVLEASKDRLTFAKDLKEIISGKIIFILKNEKISKLNYDNSEFFKAIFNKEILEKFYTYINFNNRNNLILEENLTKGIKDKNIYFTLFVNTKLLKGN